MIDTLLIDFGGVLTIGQHTPRWLALLEEKYHFSLLHKKDDVIKLIKLLDVNKLSFQQFTHELNQLFNLAMDVRDVYGLLEETVVYDKDMIRYLNELKRYYRFIMLSNQNKHLSDLVKSGNYEELRGMFDKLYFSCDIGISKPDSGIYEYVLKDAGLIAEECLFIDDKEENIVAGEKLGIKGILFKDFKQFKEKMKRI